MRPYRLIFYFFKCYLDGVQYQTKKSLFKLSILLTGDQVAIRIDMNHKRPAQLLVEQAPCGYFDKELVTLC